MEQEAVAQVIEQEEKPAPKNVAAPIPVQNLALAPKDNSELMRMIAVIAKGGGFPERFDTEAKQIAAFNLAQSLMGERWQLALNHIAIIQGQMTIYGEMPRSLCELTGLVKDFKVYLIDKEYNEISPANKNIDADPWAGVCEIQLHGRERHQYFYTMEQAIKAGQYPPMRWAKGGGKVPNTDSPWEKFKHIMLMRKSQAIGVKFETPQALVGAVIAEYDYDEAPDLVTVKDITPQTKVKELNGKFKDLPA